MDGYLCTFTNFINSPYKQLFPLLKSKKAVYIYGNHDSKRFSDERAVLFSDKQLEKYEVTLGKFTYHIEHGNHLDINLNRMDKKYFYYKKRTQLRFFFLKQIKKVWWLLFILFRKRILEFLCRKNNQEVKQLLINTVKDKVFYVYGHTHWAEIDLNYNLIITGMIQYGLGSYLIIDEDGFDLKEEFYIKFKS